LERASCWSLGITKLGTVHNLGSAVWTLLKTSARPIYSVV